MVQKSVTGNVKMILLIYFSSVFTIEHLNADS